MGLDGGTKPTRADIQRRSSWRLAQKDRSRSTRGGDVTMFKGEDTITVAERIDMQQMKLNHCAISGDPLTEPIVCCPLGMLYNREAAIKYLLGQMRPSSPGRRADMEKKYAHLTLDSLISVHFEHNPAFRESKRVDQLEAADKMHVETGRFICPVSGLETNGHYAFICLPPCGHCFSDKIRTDSAFLQLQSNRVCPTCNTPYTEAIPLCANESQIQERRKKLEAARAAAKAERAEQRRLRKQQKLLARNPSSSTTTTSSSSISTDSQHNNNYDNIANSKGDVHESVASSAADGMATANSSSGAPSSAAGCGDPDSRKRKKDRDPADESARKHKKSKKERDATRLRSTSSSSSAPPASKAAAPKGATPSVWSSLFVDPTEAERTARDKNALFAGRLQYGYAE